MVKAYLDMEEKNKSVEKQQVEEEIESQQELDLIQCNNDESKQRKRQKNTGRSSCSHTKVKARNFLQNISYRRWNKNDHTNISFVFDCISLILQNLNPFSLEKKPKSQIHQHYVKMIWERCTQKSLCKFICGE